MWQHTFWCNTVWRWDEAGFYECLAEIPPQMCRPRERVQDPRKIKRYAALYRAGSPFPPIAVLSPIPDDPLYAIIDGHHRWQAALEVGAPTIRAWVPAYHPLQGSDGRTYWVLARMSDTEEGQALARHLGLSWCPRCGRFLDYCPGEPMCLACKMYEQDIAATGVGWGREDNRQQCHPGHQSGSPWHTDSSSRLYRRCRRHEAVSCKAE